MSIKTRMSGRLEPYRRLAVWGAGGLGRSALAYWLPRAKVSLVIDSNAAATGRELSGLKVVAPDQADLAGIDAVVICTSVHREVRAALARRGFEKPVFYVYELFLPEDGGQLSELQALAIDVAVLKNNSWPVFLLTKPQIIVNATFRLANWAAGSPWLLPVYGLAYLLHAFTCLLTSIQLPVGTPIGPGLQFAHYGTIVFTRRSRIGAFFTIYHGCTVGTNDSGDAPVIGDYVYQYAGAHVLGRCRIGSQSRIGANAVVLDTECEPGTTLVGIPARPVRLAAGRGTSAGP